MNRILLCAPQSGSGKTTVTCGLLNAFRRRGLKVASFKCGPDYIDPMFHASVIGVRGRNLDPFFTEADTMRALLCRGAAGTDLSVLEGVMGYYDGLANTDRASTYEVARRTKTPAVLVLPARGMGLSAAAAVQGFCRFRENSGIAGVILNRVSPSVYPELKAAVERECGVTVYGYVPERKDLTLESRHLGLQLPEEVAALREKLDRLAELLEQTVDLDGLLRLAASAEPLEAREPALPKGAPVRIAVARDEAFCFYYEETFELLRELGAELVPFSPLRDPALPEGCGGLLLGGGYPELHGAELSRNESMRRAVREALADGMPVIAECGGFLYLHETMEDLDGKKWPLCGVYPGNCWYTGKLRRFGYVTLSAKGATPLGEEISLRGHEFHYYESDDPGADFRAVKPVRGTAWDCIHASERRLCGFPHLYLWSEPACAAAFLETCRRYAEEGKA